MKMSKRIISLLLTVIMIVGIIPLSSITANAASWDGSAAYGFEGGTGTEDDPFIIKTAEQLAFFAQSVNDGESYSEEYIRLDEDIVLNDTTDWGKWGSPDGEDIIEPLNSWIPIGSNYDFSFRGNFNGNGHTVSGVYINSNSLSLVGLFGRVYRGSIENLGITESYISAGDNSYAGAVAGVATQYSIVNNCYNSGTVISESSRTAGIVGQVDYFSTISNCYNSGTISGSGYTTGGVTALISSYASVKNCYNVGNVTGNSTYTAGVVGDAGLGTITACYSTGNVTGNSTYTAGVVGYTYADLTQCYNTGTVTGNDYTGGLAGVIAGKSGDYSAAIVDNCCNAGAVYGTGKYTGGVAGFISGTINECYNIGNINGTGQNVGGLAGSINGNGGYYSDGNVGNCYNTGMINGANRTGGLAGTIDNSGSLNNCYNTGMVLGDNYTGGLVGIVSEDSTVSVCYNIGTVAGEGNYTGGVTGYGAAKNSYYLSSCITDSNEYGTALSDEQMKTKESYKNWNFNSIWEIGFDNEYEYPTLRCLGSKEYFYRVRFFDGEELLKDELVKKGDSIVFLSLEDKENSHFLYWVNSGGKYYAGEEFVPEEDTVFRAIWKTNDISSSVWSGSIADGFESGSGSEDDPYIINTAEQLAYLASSVNEGFSYSGEHFRLEADIILNNTSDWEKWGTSSDQGDLIAPVNIWTPIGIYEDDRYDFGGHFDGNGHTVSGMYIYGSYPYAGIFGYVNFGSIKNLSITDSYVYNGGDYSYEGIIAGGVYYGAISNCYNNGTICSNNEYSHTGGIAGEVRNGTVSNCYNKGTVICNSKYDAYAGGVVGYLYYSTAKNCHNTGTVTGNSLGNYSYIGGVFGYSLDSTINDSFNNAIITDNSIGSYTTVGGVAGTLYNTAVDNCYNLGAVSGNKSETGGIGGSVRNSTISNCYNKADITGSEYSSVGGVLGSGRTITVKKCYNTGTLTSGRNGRVGGISGHASDYSTISECFNTGTINDGWAYVGGLLGYLGSYSTIHNCYNTGDLTSSTFQAGGGAIGQTGGEFAIENCYYLSGCVKKGNSFGTVLTSDQMKAEEYFEGWNFNKTWEIGYNVEYPYPTLRCFGSKEYFYNIRFFEGEVCLSDELIKEGDSISLLSLENKKDLDFKCWRSNEDIYLAGNEYIPEDDIDFQAIWTTQNTSPTVWNGSIADSFAGGKGTEDDPYLIETGAHLAYLAQLTNAGEVKKDTYFKQVADIVLNDGGEMFRDYIAGKNSWVPIGDYDYYNRAIAFCGHYDGNGYSVSGIYLYGSYDYAGLFGYAYGGSIKNLSVKESYVYNAKSYSGGIVADASNCTVSDCYNLGSIAGKYVGGVAGGLDGCIFSNCYNNGTVTGNDGSIGGVAGSIYGSTVSNCYNDGIVTGHGKSINIGGFAGEINNSTVRNCYNSCEVTGNSYDDYFCIGGVAGTFGGTLINCFNSGTVTGNSKDDIYAGGVVGLLASSGEVKHCYNNGNVIGYSASINTLSDCYVGGIVGFGQYSGTVRNCYNGGAISGNIKGSYFYLYVGGVIGAFRNSNIVLNCYNSGVVTGNGYTGGVAAAISANCTVSSCYNIGAITGERSDGAVLNVSDSEVNNCYYLSDCVASDSDYATALTDEQMKTKEAYIGFDFAECWEIGVKEGYSYPTLLGHDCKAVVTAPTCTEQGYTTYTCSHCGDSYVSDYTVAIDHTYSDWIVDVEPQIGIVGSKHRECTVCGEILEIYSIPPLMPSIFVGEIKSAVVGSEGGHAYFSFTPDEDGYYAFYSNSNEDTYGYIRDENMNELVSDDDSGSGSNFKVKYQMIAGTTYILDARFYSNMTGSFDVAIEQTKFITKLEIESLPTKTDYIKGFAYGNLNYDGLVLKATWSDNTTTVWRMNIDDYYIGDERVSFSDYSVNEDGIIRVYCGGQEVQYQLNLIDNPVSSIEIVQGTKQSYMENYNGYFTTWYNNETDEEEQVYYYYTNYPSDAIIRVNYNDGTSKTARIGEKLDGYYSSWSSNQNNKPWHVGSDNESTVSYLGVTVNLPITVVANTVESIEIATGTSAKYVENAYGYWSSIWNPETDEDEPYFNYSVNDSDFEDAIIQINYSDGSNKTARIGEIVDGYGIEWNSRQYNNPWTIGDDNYLTVSYLGKETQLFVSVVPNPVDHIEITTAPTREYMYGDNLYGVTYVDGTYDFSPTDLTGLVLTVYYIDGTNKQFEPAGGEDWGTFDGYQYWISYDGYEPEMGDFPVTFNYMGKTAYYSVVINDSSVASIEVTKLPNKTEYSEYYAPDWTGLELTIHNIDGTTDVVTLDSDNSYYGFDPRIDNYYGFRFNGNEGYIEESWDGGEYTVVYLGRTCPVEGITFVDDKAVKNVDINNFTLDGTGTQVTVTFEDDTTEVIVLDNIVFRSYGVSMNHLTVYAKTDKGVLPYYISNAYRDDELNDDDYYDVWIFGKEVKVTKQTALIGDINGDGKVNGKDGILCSQALAGWDVVYSELAADVNGDGKFNGKDGILLSQYLAGWDVVLG